MIGHQFCLLCFSAYGLGKPTLGPWPCSVYLNKTVRIWLPKGDRMCFLSFLIFWWGGLLKRGGFGRF